MLRRRKLVVMRSATKVAKVPFYIPVGPQESMSVCIAHRDGAVVTVQPIAT